MSRPLNQERNLYSKKTGGDSDEDSEREDDSMFKMPYDENLDSSLMYGKDGDQEKEDDENVLGEPREDPNGREGKEGKESPGKASKDLYSHHESLGEREVVDSQRDGGAWGEAPLEIDRIIPPHDKSLIREDSRGNDCHSFMSMVTKSVEINNREAYGDDPLRCTSDNFICMVNKAQNEVDIRKIDDADYCKVASYREGCERVLKIERLHLTHLVCDDVRVMVSVYRLKRKDKNGDTIQMCLHLIKGDETPKECFGGYFELCKADQFEASTLKIKSTGNSILWVHGTDPKNANLLTFSEPHLLKLKDGSLNQKSLCFYLDSIALPAFKFHEINTSTIGSPVLLLTGKASFFLVSPTSSAEVKTDSEDSPLVSADFYPSSSPDQASIFCTHNYSCHIYSVTFDHSGTLKCSLQKKFKIPESMTDRDTVMDSRDVFISNNQLIVVRRNEFYMWVYRIEATQNGPVASVFTRVALRPNFKRHSFFYTSNNEHEDTEIVCYQSGLNQNWSLDVLGKLNSNDLYLSDVDNFFQIDPRCPVSDDIAAQGESADERNGTESDRGSGDGGEDKPEGNGVVGQLGEEGFGLLECLVDPPSSDIWNNRGLGEDFGPEESRNEKKEERISEEDDVPYVSDTETMENGQGGSEDEEKFNLTLSMFKNTERGDIRVGLEDEGIIIPDVPKDNQYQISDQERDKEKELQSFIDISKNNSRNQTQAVIEKDKFEAFLEQQQESLLPRLSEETQNSNKSGIQTPARTVPLALDPIVIEPPKIKYHTADLPDPTVETYGGSQKNNNSNSLIDNQSPQKSGGVPHSNSNADLINKRNDNTRNYKNGTKKQERIEVPRKTDKNGKTDSANNSRKHGNQDRGRGGQYLRDDKPEFVPKKQAVKPIDNSKEGKDEYVHHSSYSPLPHNNTNDDIQYAPKSSNKKSHSGSPKNSQVQSIHPPVQVGQPPKQTENHDVHFDGFQHLVRQNLASIKEDLISHFESRNKELQTILKSIENNENRKEDRIEEIVNKVVTKYVEEKLIKDIKNEFNCLMSNNYNEVFEDIIVPCFEKYLTKVFEKISNLMEKGVKFYNERIVVEEKKVNVIKDQFNQMTTQFMNNSKGFTRIAQDLQGITKEIVSNQNKDMVKRVTALEDQIEKMNEKQDRMLDLLDKIGKKIKINEEDKKIELPTPPSALTNQQTYSNAQLNDFIDQVKSTPNMPHTAQTQQQPVITQFARIPPAQPHNTIQSNQSTYRSSVISSPHTYSNMNNTSNSVSTNQDNYQILEDIRRQLNIGNIPHNIGSSPHIQHPTSHSLSSSHFQGSNGNSVGSSTPIQRQQNTQPPNQIPSNVANEEYLNKHYQMIKLQMELGMIPPRHQSYTQEGYGQE